MLMTQHVHELQVDQDDPRKVGHKEIWEKLSKTRTFAYADDCQGHP